MGYFSLPLFTFFENIFCDFPFYNGAFKFSFWLTKIPLAIEGYMNTNYLFLRNCVMKM
jgi:hypothetical protein